MKALSVRQPWASLIVWGLKTVEIRTWTTDFRGTLAIHAARQTDDAAMLRFSLENLPRGAVIGTVQLAGIEKFTADRWSALAENHLDPGQYQAGLYAWHLQDPMALQEPFFCRGDRALFEIEIPEDSVRATR